MKKASSFQATILVIDDEVGVREALGDILGDEGYGVLTAANADEADTIVKERPIDLVLLDIWMPPGIDGVSLLRRWKDSDLLNFPVIMISAHATLNAAVEAMRYGAKDVLDKPFSSQRLLSVVRQQLINRSNQLYDPTLHVADFGSSVTMSKLKGSLLREASSKEPISIVGNEEDAPEFFAKFLHLRSSPWQELSSASEMEKSQELLEQTSNGTIYVRYQNGQNEASQRGLELLLHHALDYKVRVIFELSQSPDEMLASGKLNSKLHRKLATRVIEVPTLKEYISDLPNLANLAAKRLALEADIPNTLLTSAVSEMVSEAQRWEKDGLSRLLGILNVALEKSDSGEKISADAMRKLAGEQIDSAKISEEIYNLPWREAREIFERQYYVALMKRAQDNYQLAAQLSGLERTYLYRKIKLTVGSGDGKDSSVAA